MLIEQFMSPDVIYSLKPEALLKTKIIDETTVNDFCQSRSLVQATKDLSFLEKNKISLLLRHDPQFPKSLLNLYTPPLALYAKGDLSLLQAPLSIAIIGSRNPTIAGEKYTKLFSQSLSSVGITIVSGLADGIDGKSHWGSINELGSTIGVLGTGMDICYPRVNQKLFDLMAQKGLLLSEFNLGEKPLPYHFPQRNRIISGLSQGVLVIEARKKSGSLITVNHALEQGKNVYVIPGDIGSSNWAGGNQLLKEGAKLVTDPSDILEDYVLFNQYTDHSEAKTDPYNKQTELKLANPDEQLLFDLIKKGYRTIDDLVAGSGLPINQVTSLLTMMEITEIIQIKYGNILLI
ncbi:DNA-processing protein DprA [Acetobacterium wieringae]|uniref:DNA-processing protein DprA n=1 Tax=Acetobacterium wieringae TaxID=52694 RepID=UPI0026EF0282|nr:DNA-processing protein DprA [Acetobacterium wieringae]